MTNEIKWVIRGLIIAGVIFVVMGLVGCGSAATKECSDWYVGQYFYNTPKWERVCTQGGFTCKEIYFNNQVQDTCFSGSSPIDTPPSAPQTTPSP